MQGSQQQVEVVYIFAEVNMKNRSIVTSEQVDYMPARAL